MHVASVVAVARPTAIRVVVADVHSAFDCASANVVRDFFDLGMARHALRKDKFVLVSWPFAKHVQDSSVLDYELDDMPGRTLDAVVHHHLPPLRMLSSTGPYSPLASITRLGLLERQPKSPDDLDGATSSDRAPTGPS
jgi:hypothetical protein